jgi:hypothetical protein
MKKQPKRANGARTVQENMRRKYMEEAWRELCNWIESQFIGDKRVEYAMEYFMASKGIAPKEQP